MKLTNNVVENHDTQSGEEYADGELVPYCLLLLRLSALIARYPVMQIIKDCSSPARMLSCFSTCMQIACR